MRFVKGIFLLAITLYSSTSYGQQDSIVPSLTDIPLQFIQQANQKISTYSNRITSKTENTLEKLTKWENKIHTLLLKASPETAQQLFGEGSTTFAAMLAKIKEGKLLVENEQLKYDAYRDNLVTNIKYIATQKALLQNKYIAPLQTAKQKIAQLENDVAATDAAEKLIKERTKLLLQQAYKVLGKNRLLNKIGAENYYYAETLKNYKTLFEDTKKAEKLALDILQKIPAAKAFIQNNSMVASLFGSPSIGSTASLAGLQTRASVNALIQGRIAAGGPNAAAQISANMQAAQAELSKLKDKIIKAATTNTVEGEDGLPNFKPNTQKTKTLKQRLEVGSNLHFGKPTRFASSQADIAISVGYKLNDKSIVGLGVAYKLNYGAVSNFYLQHGGIGARSFIDYKITRKGGGTNTGGLFISGGFEMNYSSVFTNLLELQTRNMWQSSGLIGLTKKIKIKTKYVKGIIFQLLYDVLYKTHEVATQPVVFRVGYNF